MVNLNYISAFAPPSGISDSAIYDQMQDSNCYTIQVCSMEHHIHDIFFQKNSKIRIIPIGDIYRYIFSFYPTLEAARKDLIRIRLIFPDAYIREYRAGKLGMAIDLNIDHLRINN